MKLAPAHDGHLADYFDRRADLLDTLRHLFTDQPSSTEHDMTHPGHRPTAQPAIRYPRAIAAVPNPTGQLAVPASRPDYPTVIDRDLPVLAVHYVPPAPKCTRPAARRDPLSFPVAMAALIVGCLVLGFAVGVILTSGPNA